MAYEKINWLNKGEAGAKPINKENLNHMDNGIEANDKKLSDILNSESITLTFNEEYVYSSDLEYECFKIGKMVFLNIRTIAFKQSPAESGTQLISGLPKSNNYSIFYMHGGNNASSSSVRCAVSPEGNIVTHYTNISHVGDSSNSQYDGTLIYRTNE